jgi:hypothetical protein
MAFIEDYGKPEGDPGRPFVYGHDPETKVEIIMFVRRIPLNMYNAINKRYGKEERQIMADGGTEIRRVRSEDDWFRFVRDHASFCLADVQNLTINVRDDESAKKWSQALNREVEQGPLTLDGILTGEAKKRLLTLAPKLGGFIIEMSQKLNEEYAKREEELAGN